MFSPIGTIAQTYQRSGINVNFNAQAKKLYWFGSYWNYNPANNDFYEPRSEGYFFRRGKSVMGGAWFESNASKKYYFNIETAIRRYIDFYGQAALDAFLIQRYRFNDRLSLSYQFSFQPRFNNVGYTDKISSDIIFARRRINTVENIFSVKYSFTNKMGITFRGRHYNSSVYNRNSLLSGLTVNYQAIVL
ncbi:MAG: DUF5916 domain-containing protein [Bacteroidota bacterium]